jgi:hypothetical protein
MEGNHEQYQFLKLDSRGVLEHCPFGWRYFVHHYRAGVGSLICISTSTGSLTGGQKRMLKTPQHLALKQGQSGRFVTSDGYLRASISIAVPGGSQYKGTVRSDDVSRLG